MQVPSHRVGMISRRNLLQSLIGVGLAAGALPLLAACGGSQTATTTISPVSASTGSTVAAQSTGSVTSALASPASTAAPGARSTTASVLAAQSAPATAKGGCTIVWSFWAVSQEQADNTLTRVKDFNLTHPNIKVQALFVQNGDYRAKISSLISGGTPPQFTQVDAYDMAYFVQKSPIRDAHVFMDAYNKGEVLPIPLIPQWQDYGKIYNAAFNKVRAGTSTVTDALSAIKMQTDALLAIQPPKA